jgi:hypothetical protein
LNKPLVEPLAVSAAAAAFAANSLADPGIANIAMSARARIVLIFISSTLSAGGVFRVTGLPLLQQV